MLTSEPMKASGARHGYGIEMPQELTIQKSASEAGHAR